MFYIDNETVTNDKYDMAKFMDFSDEGVFDSLNSYMLYQIPRLPLAGQYTLKKHENRPDLISYDIYGDMQYWWIIMWYNHFVKPQDFKIGRVIKFPSISAVEQLYLNASLLKKVK